MLPFSFHEETYCVKVCHKPQIRTLIQRAVEGHSCANWTKVADFQRMLPSRVLPPALYLIFGHTRAPIAVVPSYFFHCWRPSKRVALLPMERGTHLKYAGMAPEGTRSRFRIGNDARFGGPKPVVK